MDWLASIAALLAPIAFVWRELRVKETPPEKLLLQVCVVAVTAVGGAFVTMLIAQQAWPLYSSWARLEASVDDAPFVVGGALLGLVEGVGLGIWQARKINNEPLNQKRARP